MLAPGLAGALDGVSYIDADGSTKTVDGVTELATDADFPAAVPITVMAGASGSPLTAGWYVTTCTAPIDRVGTITISGDVHLILGDGCSLNVTAGNSAGILVRPGDHLTLYAQSTGSNMGSLTAISLQCAAGIGGGTGEGDGCFYTGPGGSGNGDAGTITINGGRITAASNTTSVAHGYLSGGAGIGGSGGGFGPGSGGKGGQVTINGGIVVATGGNSGPDHPGGGAGIGGGAGCCDTGDGGDSGSVTINGGTVTATGGNSNVNGGGGAGIGGGGGGGGTGAGGYGGTVTINGGTVTATGGDNGDSLDNGDAAGIGGGGGGIMGLGGGGSTVVINDGTVTAISSGLTGFGGGVTGAEYVPPGVPVSSGVCQASGSLTLPAGYNWWGGPSSVESHYPPDPFPPLPVPPAYLPVTDCYPFLKIETTVPGAFVPSYSIGFPTPFSLNNGLQATPSAPASAQAGETVTVTVTFSGTATETGTQVVTLSSDTLDAGAIHTKAAQASASMAVTAGQTMGAGNTLSFTFVMPAANVTNLVLQQSFIPAAISVGGVTATVPTLGQWALALLALMLAGLTAAARRRG